VKLRKIIQIVNQNEYYIKTEHGPLQLTTAHGQNIIGVPNQENHFAPFSKDAGIRGEKRMVTANELCTAIEALLAIDYTKRYMPWKEQNIVNLARALAKQYRDDTNSIPPEEVLALKPSEEKTWQEGQLEFDFSEPTEPDASVPESLQAIPSSVDPELTSKSAYWSFDIPATVDSKFLERHPALPY
jgi:hypothetical protein